MRATLCSIKKTPSLLIVQNILVVKHSAPIPFQRIVWLKRRCCLVAPLGNNKQFLVSLHGLKSVSLGAFLSNTKCAKSRQKLHHFPGECTAYHNREKGGKKVLIAVMQQDSFLLFRWWIKYKRCHNIYPLCQCSGLSSFKTAHSIFTKCAWNKRIIYIFLSCCFLRIGTTRQTKVSRLIRMDLKKLKKKNLWGAKVQKGIKYRRWWVMVSVGSAAGVQNESGDRDEAN